MIFTVINRSLEVGDIRMNGVSSSSVSTSETLNPSTCLLFLIHRLNLLLLGRLLRLRQNNA